MQSCNIFYPDLGETYPHYFSDLATTCNEALQLKQVKGKVYLRSFFFVDNHVSILARQGMDGHFHMEKAVCGTLAHRFLHDIRMSPLLSLTQSV